MDMDNNLVNPRKGLSGKVGGGAKGGRGQGIPATITTFFFNNNIFKILNKKMGNH